LLKLLTAEIFEMTSSNLQKPKRIIPIVLCGGSGSRLWPLSLWNMPKQFLRILGQRSLIESTLLRCRADVFDPRPIIVGSDSHGTILRQTIEDLGIEAEIILEPDRRDSCAAILAGVLVAAKRDPDAMIMVMAADHEIPDAIAFATAANLGAVAAAQGHLVTFGVKPQNPATGYGYILAGAALNATAVFKVARFVEKPNLETAQKYLDEGYVWNSGNFMFSASSVLEEAAQLAPDVLSAAKLAVNAAKFQDNAVLLNRDAFSKAPRISFDYAIMEKTGRAAVLPVGYRWSDIGSWDAVADMSPADEKGNVAVGKVELSNARNVFVHSQALQTIVIGCDDISVITTPEAVLVVRKGQSEKIKSVLETLAAKQ
jgi:mannose-1-phosphate guanylyltransferase / mannose-6-phosphate isomerase